MTIKFILAKFAEVIIKSFIIICFIALTLIFVYEFSHFLYLNFSIDIFKIETCVDLGIGGWDYKERVCTFGLY
jgi:hypothetical protein